MKDVQCYELFGGIALKNHAFSYFFFISSGNSNHSIGSNSSISNTGGSSTISGIGNVVVDVVIEVVVVLAVIVALSTGVKTVKM